MQRHLWKSHISPSSCPRWGCPVCSRGALSLRRESLNYEETVASKRSQQSVDWCPEEIEFTFNAWADCIDENCKQSFAIAGIGGIEQEYTGDEDGSTEWVNCFYPKFVTPTLRMIEIPSRCPKAIKQILEDAFACFWSQPDACAGRIRVGIEVLLSHIGIPTEDTKESGKQVDLTLHRRIELYTNENPLVGQQLMAIKWLGNAGSHSSILSQDDILDALELLENSLVEILDKRSEKMAELTKSINAKHNPKAP